MAAAEGSSAGGPLVSRAAGAGWRPRSFWAGRRSSASGLELWPRPARPLPLPGRRGPSGAAGTPGAQGAGGRGEPRGGLAGPGGPGRSALPLWSRGRLPGRGGGSGALGGLGGRRLARRVATGTGDWEPSASGRSLPAARHLPCLPEGSLWNWSGCSLIASMSGSSSALTCRLGDRNQFR